jgi:hypothetical protein
VFAMLDPMKPAPPVTSIFINSLSYLIVGAIFFCYWINPTKEEPHEGA